MYNMAESRTIVWLFLGESDKERSRVAETWSGKCMNSHHHEFNKLQIMDGYSRKDSYFYQT